MLRGSSSRGAPDHRHHRHDPHQAIRPHSERRRRAAVHLLLPPGGLHHNLARAYEREQSPAAKDAIAQILINSRMCAEGHRPICQDTGIVTVFVKLGMDVRFDGCHACSLDGDGQRRSAPRVQLPDNKLRASMLADPAGSAQTPRTIRPPWSASPSCRAARRRDRGGQGRRLGSQVEVHHAQSLRLRRGLGRENRAHHGRGLVSAGHAGHRHRRHRGKSHGAGQGIAHGSDRHAGPASRAARAIAPKNCASRSTTRSTRSASARRAWADSPRCWTSRSSTTRRTPPSCRSP